MMRQLGKLLGQKARPCVVAREKRPASVGCVGCSGID
jgi:hypothetical protein